MDSVVDSLHNYPNINRCLETRVKVLSWIVPLVILSCTFAILVSFIQVAIVRERVSDTLKVIVLSIFLIGGSIFAQNQIESMNKDYSIANSASTNNSSQTSNSFPSPSETSSPESNIDYHGRVN